MTRRVADGSYSRAWRRVSKIILVPGINALMKLEWRGQENFPREGGMILAANHLSYADVLAISLFSYRAGNYPVFLAKSSLFGLPLLGPILVKLGQLPVYRDATDAALVLKDAEKGIKNGAGVIFYPEATVTRDPGLWPMMAKTGVARLALATGKPVIPIAHWGAQRVLPYGSFLPRVIPRRTVKLIAGPPVDLSEFEGQPLTTAVLRGEAPPEQLYHPAVERRKTRQALRALQEAQKSQEDPKSAVTGNVPDPGSTDAGDTGADTAGATPR